MAAKRKVAAEVKAEAPRREQELKMKEKEAEMEIEKTKQKEEARLSAEAEAKKAKEEAKIAELTGTHAAHAGLVRDITRTKKGRISHATGEVELYEGHISSRQQAIESGKALQAIRPSEELAKNIGTWEHEINELKDTMKAMKDEKRQKTSPKAAKKDKKRQDAVESAAQAQEAEAERLAISRMITEGVYSTNPAFDPRRTGGRR